MAKHLFRFIAVAFTVLFTAAFGQTATEKILHNFGRLTGAEPYAAPVFDAAGNLYGTTSEGGQAYQGSVYRLDSGGIYTVLHRFTGASSGSIPTGVVTDATGALYGAVGRGGTYGWGYVYKLNPSGKFSVLYNFSNVPDGATPNSPLVRDAAGNLYGTTAAGGGDSFCNPNCGTVFKLDPAGNETVLYPFSGNSGGFVPLGVTRDEAGNFYGVTQGGGANGMGVLFKIDPAGLETVLYSFTADANEGRQPNGWLLVSTSGLYGTTVYGGKNNLGVVFRYDSANNFSVIYDFKGGNNAANPVSGLVADAAGNMYGSSGGGNGPCGGGCGVVYKIDPNGYETVLHSFNQTDGWYPIGIVPDAAGDLYGATEIGGAYDGGTLFKLDPAGEEKLLYSFSNGESGIYPDAGVILDGDGKLYGTTEGGGIDDWGTVYTLSASGDYKVLYAFQGQSDGGSPRSGLIADTAGNFYGTTSAGGISANGVVYQIDQSGKETVLYRFTGSGDGSAPSSGLAMDVAGDLFGVTPFGGMSGPCVDNSCGVVFRLSPDGTETVLHNFTGGEDGESPSSAPVLDVKGNLYGTAFNGGAFNQGLIYKIDAAGNYSSIYDFQGGARGTNPNGTFVIDAAGNIYGPADGGDFKGPCFGTSPYGCGILYKLDTSGNLTVLHTFGGSDGIAPLSVVFDSAGNLYGNTILGGLADVENGSGLVFRLGAGGSYSVVYRFDCEADTGCMPIGTLAVDRAGSIYGTTSQGGERQTGVLYRLTP